MGYWRLETLTRRLLIGGQPPGAGEGAGKGLLPSVASMHPGRRRQLLAGPPLFHVASTSGHRQVAVPGEKLLERLLGGLPGTAAVAAATRDRLPMTFILAVLPTVHTDRGPGFAANQMKSDVARHNRV